MTTMQKFSHAANDVQGQLDEQMKQLTRWMKPRMRRLSKDLRPYGERAFEMAKRNPGKTVIGALVVGFLLARFGRH
jgi:hypothetical protein